MTLRTGADLIAFACDRLEATKGGEEGAHETLTLLLDHYLVLPEEIGLALDAYRTLVAAHAASQNAARMVRLRHALRHLRSDPFPSRVYAFREQLDRLRDPTAFERLGTSREELAALRRQAEERHMGKGPFLASFKERFERSIEPSHAKQAYSGFESLLTHFKAYAIRPEEIGTSEAELRTRWQRARVAFAGRLWASLSAEWADGLNRAKEAHDLAHVLKQGVVPNDINASQAEIDARLHRAFVFEASEMLEGVRRERRVYSVACLKKFCEAWGVEPAECGLAETFENLEAEFQGIENDEASRADERRLRRDAERYGVTCPVELTSDERAAVQRRIWVRCVRRSIETGDDLESIEGVGDVLDRMRHVGRSLYGETFPSLAARRPDQLDDPGDRLTHEEVGLTREAFVLRMRDALVARLRALIEQSLTQDAMHEEEMGEGESHPADLLDRLHEAVGARVTTYEELGATPARLKRLSAYAYDLVRYASV